MTASEKPSAPRIVMVGRFEAPKDHSTLLRALSFTTALPWTLELIGDGPGLAGVQVLVEELGLRERVHFSGGRRDLAERLARAQVCALISDLEGLPLSVLEAMRAGLPVIATNVGGLPQAVQNGITGWLVPPRQPVPLADKLMLLLGDADLRQRLGAAGRAYFLERFVLDLVEGEGAPTPKRARGGA